MICRAGVASEVWCSCGVEIFASSFESSSSAVYVLVEVIIATCCSVQAYAIQVLAMFVQICTHAGEACVEMFALVWRHSEHPPSFGFFCRKQRLSTAASHKTVPIHRSCILGRGVVYRVRAHRSPVSHVGRSLALASLLIHIVECCSALRICRRCTYGAMAAG